MTLPWPGRRWGQGEMFLFWLPGLRRGLCPCRAAGQSTSRCLCCLSCPLCCTPRPSPASLSHVMYPPSHILVLHPAPHILCPPPGSPVLRPVSHPAPCTLHPSPASTHPGSQSCIPTSESCIPLPAPCSLHPNPAFYSLHLVSQFCIPFLHSVSHILHLTLHIPILQPSAAPCILHLSPASHILHPASQNMYPEPHSNPAS